MWDCQPQYCPRFSYFCPDLSQFPVLSCCFSCRRIIIRECLKYSQVFMGKCCQTKECFPQSILKLDLGSYNVQRGFCLLCTSAPKIACSLTSFHCRLGTCGRENRLDDSVCFATQIGHKLFPQFRLQGELAYKPKLFNFALPCRTSVHSSIQKPVAGGQV